MSELFFEDNLPFLTVMLGGNKFLSRRFAITFDVISGDAAKHNHKFHVTETKIAVQLILRLTKIFIQKKHFLGSPAT